MLCQLKMESRAQMSAALLHPYRAWYCWKQSAQFKIKSTHCPLNKPAQCLVIVTVLFIAPPICQALYDKSFTHLTIWDIEKFSR